jgi:hypothetical protein
MAGGMLKNRRKNIKSEVRTRISDAKKEFESLSGKDRKSRIDKGSDALETALKKSSLFKRCKCPSCGFDALVAGESQNRGPVTIDEESLSIRREVRVLPNAFRCQVCKLRLDGYQELLEANLGTVFTTVEEEDPIDFFGITPEDNIHEQEYDNE